MALFAEILGLGGRSVSHHHELRATLADGIHCVTQLRDLLAAKESTKMPDKNQHNGTVFPVTPEPDLPTLEIQHFNPCES